MLKVLDEETRAAIRTALPGGWAGLVERAVEANLDAMQAIASVAADPDYLRSQDPADVAVLHRAIADHTMRLLGVAGRLRPKKETPVVGEAIEDERS